MTVAQTPPETSAAQSASRTELVGRAPMLTLPARTYVVTNNPFAVSAVLPALVLSFLAVEIALLAGADRYITACGFTIVALGLLLIPAVALKGSLTVTDGGIVFARGKDRLSAGWGHVSSLAWRPDCGLCLTIHGQSQSKPKWRLPGGFHAIEGDGAQIPLRMFGDRQFSVLYDVRDRLPESATMPALQRAASREGMKLYLYGGVVLLDVIALGVTAWVYHS